MTPENKNLEIIYEVKDHPQFNFVKRLSKKIRNQHTKNNTKQRRSRGMSFCKRWNDTYSS